jgi:CubicO group peptidase (beta-lactamase class C family)
VTARGLRPAGVALLATSAVTLAACTDTAQPAARTSASASPTADIAALADRSDDLFARTLHEDEPGCSAAVGIEGEVVWVGARGVADLERGRPIEVSTTFPIASVSKQFTATVVLLLADDGELSLADPLADWLPDLPPWSERVTIGDAMRMTSGIPDYVALRERAGVGWTERRTQRDSLAEITAMQELDFPPGERFEYSNSNYFLLTEIVRAATGHALPDVVDDRIFEPLGLRMRYEPLAWSPDADDPSSARGYVRAADGGWEPGGTRWEPHGDAGIQTTPSDLVRWGDVYRTGEVGAGQLLDDVLTDATDVGRGQYGAGIIERADGTLWHDGYVPGFLTDFAVSEDRRTVIAVACNGDRGPSSALGYLATALHEQWTD